MSTEKERYERAQKRVKEIKDFYTHVVVYIAVIGFLAIINLMTSSFPWVVFPAGGWGIGLVIHGFTTFFIEGPWGAAWEERKIRELMAKEDGRKVKNEDYFQES